MVVQKAPQFRLEILLRRSRELTHRDRRVVERRDDVVLRTEGDQDFGPVGRERLDDQVRKVDRAQIFRGEDQGTATGFREFLPDLVHDGGEVRAGDSFSLIGEQREPVMGGREELRSASGGGIGDSFALQPAASSVEVPLNAGRARLVRADVENQAFDAGRRRNRSRHSTRDVETGRGSSPAGFGGGLPLAEQLSIHRTGERGGRSVSAPTPATTNVDGPIARGDRDDGAEQVDDSGGKAARASAWSARSPAH
jgi:hypothetical protein